MYFKTFAHISGNPTPMSCRNAKAAGAVPKAGYSMSLEKKHFCKFIRASFFQIAKVLCHVQSIDLVCASDGSRAQANNSHAAFVFEYRLVLQRLLLSHWC